MTTSLIHFGLAKTATTYLQKSVFPEAGGVTYLGKPFRTPARAALKSVTQMAWHPPLDRFRKDEAALRSKDQKTADFISLQRQLRGALSAGTLNIWSHEGLLRPTRDTAPFMRARALRNLHGVFTAAGSHETHALLILRDTRTLMASYARQFLHEPAAQGLGDCAFDDLCAARAGAPADPAAATAWRLWYSYFDFGALIADLHSVFGTSHVHVLNYDRLAGDWGALQAAVSALHPAARLEFPDLRVNDSRAKTQEISSRLRCHLQALDGFDLSRLYPDNDRHLAAS